MTRSSHPIPLALTSLALLAASTAVAAQSITRTPWQMHEGQSVILLDAGDLDADAFRSAVEAEVSDKAKAGGAGRVTGFGVTEGAGGKEIPTWDSIDSIYGAKKGA